MTSSHAGAEPMIPVDLDEEAACSTPRIAQSSDHPLRSSHRHGKKKTKKPATGLAKPRQPALAVASTRNFFQPLPRLFPPSPQSVSK